MKKSIGSFFMGDRVIWAIFFFLCAISLTEVFSAVSTLAYKSGNYWQPLLNHAFMLLGGAIIVWGTHRVHCRYFKVLPLVLCLATLVTLPYVLISGAVVNGASRWIEIGFFRFQPSEIGKAAVVTSTALILSRTQTEEGASNMAFKLIMYIAAPVILLIFSENLSTAAILFLVVLIMMFIGRVPLRQIGKLLGVLTLVGGIAFGLMYGAYKSDTDNKLADIPIAGKVFHRAETWFGRLENRFQAGDEDDPSKFDTDNNAQVAHANIAIASCNYVGKMPGNSVERDFLSQAFSDFIFAIIIEELGIWGGVIVVLLYVFLLFRVGRIASRCEKPFPPFLAMGVALLLVTQAMVNMSVAVGLIPVTGQPLPLISRGGSSTWINCFYIGVILSVSRYSTQAKKPEHTSFDGPMKGIKHEPVKEEVNA